MLEIWVLLAKLVVHISGTFQLTRVGSRSPGKQRTCVHILHDLTISLSHSGETREQTERRKEGGEEEITVDLILRARVNSRRGSAFVPQQGNQLEEEMWTNSHVYNVASNGCVDDEKDPPLREEI